MNNKETLISVVIPVYNVQEYLAECLESIINQTYHNLDIIVINDGSTDDSRFISHDFKKKDSRIRVIDKVNGGLSDARNVGIDLAIGEFLVFVDSDDKLEHSYVEELVRLQKKYKTKIAMCGYYRNLFYPRDIKVEEKLLSSIDILNDYKVEYVVAWNKLYCKDLFTNVRFPYGKIHEDEFTTHKLIIESKNVACTTKQLYYYRERSGSITSKQWSPKKLDGLEALEYRINSLTDIKYRVHVAQTKRAYIRQILENLFYLQRLNNPEYYTITAELEDKLRDINLRVLSKVEYKNIKWTIYRKLYFLSPQIVFKLLGLL